MIEAPHLAVALAGAKAGFDVVQAEKFSPADIAALTADIAHRPRRPIVAAAGGVTTKTPPPTPPQARMCW